MLAGQKISSFWILVSIICFSFCLTETSARFSSSSFKNTLKVLNLAKPCHPREKLKSFLLELKGGVGNKVNRRNTSSRFGSANLVNKSKSKVKKYTANSGNDSFNRGSGISNIIKMYQDMLPITRFYMTCVALMTLIGQVVGDEIAQDILALDYYRVLYRFQVWRPITAACFLGPPSIGWLFSCYYLFQYGSSLENSYGTAQHIVFLLSQITILSMVSTLFNLTFFSPCIITSMLHLLSRTMPNQKVKWLIFTVPYWLLPYGLMVTDMLQTGSMVSAVPHVLGILSGHFYYFNKFIWPKIGGVDWLKVPNFIGNSYCR